MNIAEFYSTEGQELPSYQTSGSVGVDLSAWLQEEICIRPNTRATIPTGLHVSLKSGYMGMVCSRSGLAAKNGVFVLNAPGVIDSDYKGEIKVILYNSGDDPFVIHSGDRIAQIVFSQVSYSDSDVKDVVREEGGLGSTGV